MASTGLNLLLLYLLHAQPIQFLVRHINLDSDLALISIVVALPQLAPHVVSTAAFEMLVSGLDLRGADAGPAGPRIVESEYEGNVLRAVAEESHGVDDESLVMELERHPGYLYRLTLLADLGW